MALDKTDRDLVSLSVLALLMAGPKHTYEMHRMIVDTRKDFVTGLPRSMYHAVNRLAKTGHIEPVETVRDNRKPERTVFAISDRGRNEVQERIERLLRLPDANSTPFSAALSFISCLPPERAADALRQRRDALTLRSEQLEADLANVPAQLPRVLVVEVEYELASTRSQLTWIQGLLDEIDTGDLTWPADVALLADAGGSEEHRPNYQEDRK